MVHKRSKYGEERQLVKKHAFYDHPTRELVNFMDLFFFVQGEVLKDPFDRGTLQRDIYFLDSVN